jgi:hypothetical protein
VLQAVTAKARSSTLLPLRTSRGPAALRVMAFHEDNRQPLKRLESLKMKTNEARTVQRKGKQQLQKTRDTINRREWASAAAALTQQLGYCSSAASNSSIKFCWPLYGTALAI